MKKVIIASIPVAISLILLSFWFLKPKRDLSTPKTTLQGNWETADRKVQWCFQGDTMRKYNAHSDALLTETLRVVQEMPQQNAIIFYVLSDATGTMKFSEDGKQADLYLGTSEPIFRFEYQGSKCGKLP